MTSPTAMRRALSSLNAAEVPGIDRVLTIRTGQGTVEQVWP